MARTVQSSPGLKKEKKRMGKTRESSSTAVKSRNGNGHHPEPTHEQIAARAYQIFQERGDTPGDPLSDWVRAERELATVAEAPLKTAKPRKKPATRAATA
jgi:hypothetical protein